jgi:hypothetical protein
MPLVSKFEKGFDMSQCEPIFSLVLDDKSRNTLESIKKKHAFGGALAGVVTLGVVSNIFTNSNSAQAAYNISHTDWVLYANAMKAVPVITRRAIEKDVEQMIVHYKINYDRKHLKFWEGIYSGCN